MFSGVKLSMGSFILFIKETKLPPKEAFYSKLDMTGISEEDYEHANRVWKEFGLKDLGEYHDLYLKWTLSY